MFFFICLRVTPTKFLIYFIQISIQIVRQSIKEKMIAEKNSVKSDSEKHVRKEF